MKTRILFLILSTSLLAAVWWGRTAVSAAPSVPLQRLPATGSDGEEPDNGSDSPRITADGRYIVFQSYASNLVPNDTNGDTDAFVYDRIADSVTIVSLLTNGSQLEDGLTAGKNAVDISDDGRYVVFHSASADADDASGQNVYEDIFLRDRELGTLTQVTHAFDGTATDGPSINPSISGDGRSIVFRSSASNLTPADNNNTYDIFVYDVASQTIHRVTQSFDGGDSNDRSIPARESISADGRYIFFHSWASNLTPDDTTTLNADVFRYDRDADGNGIFDESGPGQTNMALISVTPDGNAVDAFSFSSAMSRNGRYVLFSSGAENLVANDSNGVGDVFLRDMLFETTELISVRTDGSQGIGNSTEGVVSEDGTIVIFQTMSALTSDDTNTIADIYMRDWQTGTTTLLSLGSVPANAHSYFPIVSPNGRIVMFESDASNLIASDTNAATDIFILDTDAPNYMVYLPFVQK
ncbi:MAG: PD40 domain-containing protein [Anaerolineales bacterium]|nr:PD40 domain-containing protein [Anaerolineales bacterium]MCB9003921.1 PD40 domain-containing protein [Ardenticatenaceae bacterium]